jgi:transcriptional regulator with XRE-family HTH domain
MGYTIRGLFDKLGITLAELSRRSGISDVTLASIRDGKSARRSTINTLLDTFSDIYGIELSIDNVSGIIIKDKLARLGAEESNIRTTKKGIEPSISTPVQSARAVTEKAPKRVYNLKQKDTSLPEGCILASKFAEQHGIPRPTFIDHMTRGLGPGLIGTHTDTIPQRDQVAYSERVKPGRPKEKEKYLTSNQQAAAIAFWKRHEVVYSQCNRLDCRCH